MGASKNKATYFTVTAGFHARLETLGPRKLPVESDVQVGPVELST